MKLLQKIQMAVLALCLFFAMNMQAANKWDGTVAAGFASGSGTSANPYIISNEPEFAYLLQQIAAGSTFSGKYIKQTRDLNLTNVDLCVSNTFSGDYNGNGCAIVTKSKLFETVSGSIHNVRVYSDNVCPIAETLSYGYIYNIYRFSTRPFASSATSALVVNTNNGYIYNSFVDTDGNTGSNGQKAISVALKNTGTIENCVNNITNDEWGRYDDYDCQSYLANENTGRICYCYSNGNVSVTNLNGTIMYTHCYGWMPTGNFTGCTSSGSWDTVYDPPIYQSYVSSLNSWVSNNNYSRSYSTWKVGTIPLVTMVPDSYQVEYWDQYFDYTLTKNIAYGAAIGDMPIPQGDAEFLGWYYNGTKVTSASQYDYGVTLNAQWKWNIRTQPSCESMTVEVDDEAHALYQWKRYTKFTNFEDWKSDNQGVGGSTSSKTYKFDALAGDTLKFTYSLSSEAYDKFNVKLNNVELINIGGNQTNSFKFNIETAGSYELVMSYKKDASGNAGLDGVEVMDISVSNAVQNIEGATSRTLTQYELTGTNGYCCEVSYTNNSTILTSNIVTVSAHSVLYYVNGELYHSDIVREGETFKPADAPVAGGFVFSGWEGLPDDMTMSTKDIIVNATFKPVADTDITEIANTIYFDNCEAFCGKTIELPIKMKNSINVTGFQFDIVLPEGVSVVQDEDGFNDITLSTERTTAAKTNTFDSSCMSDGSIRVLAASTRNYAFSGTDGEVCVIKLSVSEDLPAGDYPIILKNIELTNATGQTWNVERLKRTITVKDYQLGDANGDGRVSVGDFSAIASHILGSTPDGFNLGAADVNQDNNISVGDLSAVATMILTEEAGGASKVKAKAPEAVSDPDNFIYADPVTISADGDATIVFNMKNAIAATGFQFNFKLPEGFYVTEDEDGFLDVYLSQTRTTSRRTNTFDCVKWSDGSYRVLAASTKNYEFSGNDGEVVTVHIQKDDAVESGDYELVLADIELTNAQGGTFRTSKATYPIVVPSNSNEYELVDGENYSNATTTAYDALTFTKTFSASAVGNWNAFYVPMSIDVEEYTGELDFAEIYAFCATVDTNGDGTVNADDENFLFVRPVKTGCIEANVPYLIRPHEAKTYTINSADNILHKAENGYVEFSTTLDKFTVTGLNEAYTVVAGDNNYYVSASGKLNYRTTGSTSVKANRWIMHRESKKYGSNSSAASEAKGYRIVALGEDMDEADAIEMIKTFNIEVAGSNNVYAIDGKMMNDANKLQKGIYIRNGKKYIVK